MARGKGLRGAVSNLPTARWDNRPLEEMEKERKIPASKLENGKQKVHIDLYLKSKVPKLWERGGRRAFAKHHKMEFAAEVDFDKLFEKY